MKRLLYCVLSGSGAREKRGLRGVDGRPVRLVARGALSAATSVVTEVPLVATLARIEAYERVVEEYFAEQAVVPMRFGSILDSEEQVAGFLKERGALFREQLRELEGQVEMGLRLLQPRPLDAGAHGPAPRPAAARPPAAPGSGSGRAYLEARARWLPPDEGPVERYRRAFQGLYTRLEVELPAPLRLTVGPDGRLGLAAGGPATDQFVAAAARRGGQGALSLAFLVPRERVEEFRAAFARLPEKAGCRLSGPWPPYSFVSR